MSTEKLTLLEDKGDKVIKNWDKGLDFVQTRAKLERGMKETRRGTTYSNWAVLYIQLLNGSRVSEAVDAFNEFLRAGKRDLEIRVRKRWHKDKQTGVTVPIVEYRRMIVPEFVKREGTPRTPTQVKVFAFRHGLNTHSLRYSFISYLGEQGVAPQLIAKITHHKKLERILDYTQQKAADELLDRIVKSERK